MPMFMASALIIGSTGGIGAAVKNVLVKRGDEVVGLSRSVDGLDVTNEASIKQLFEAHQGQFDLVLIATGALTVDGHVPEKSIKALDPSAMVGQFLVNAVGPALVLKHAIRLLPRDRPSAIVALSARVGSIGDNKIGGWHSYRMAKAAVNQLIHGAAIELARTHKRASCVCM
jgi:NAD(P)-dependent dehydrogenase (short-subunit alcohol dehydrogenase family)